MELDDLRNEDGVALFDEVLDDPSTDVLLMGERVMKMSEMGGVRVSRNENLHQRHR